MRRVESKKRKVCRPRNRYAARAKLSEHKFLRVLRGYAEGRTIAELEPRTHVSAKTIRTTYAALRERLPQAVRQQPDAFGQAGRLLIQGDALRQDGAAFLDALAESRLHRRHRLRHAPRLAGVAERQLLVFETAVRLLCALDLRGLTACESGRETLLRELGGLVSSLNGKDWPVQICSALPGARRYQFPHGRLFDDYRRYLLRNPLGG